MPTRNLSYREGVVKKPWGHEYLMFDNGLVGVWCLFIKGGERTSLHCHPRKKTGLVLLSGQASVSFLNDSMPLDPLDKLMIREGLFHSTQAISPEGISLIEIETPSDKTNLVRLDDAYGREGKRYEGAESIEPFTQECLRLSEPSRGQKDVYAFNDCVLGVEKVHDSSECLDRNPGEVIVVLKGGLFSQGDEPIVSPGDVVSSEILRRLAQSFSAPQGATLLTLRRAK